MPIRIVGLAPTVAAVASFTLGLGAVTLSGEAPIAVVGVVRIPVTGGMRLAGPLKPGPAIVTLDGSLAVAGAAPTVVFYVVAAPTVGGLSAVGQAPRAALTIATGTGTLTVAGPAVAVPTTHLVVLPVGALAVVGSEPAAEIIEHAPGIQIICNPDAGALTFKGPHRNATVIVAPQTGGLIVACTFTVSLTAPPLGPARAFPGAEGYGTETRHAYGNPPVAPIVIRVNTLADNTTALTTNADGTRSGSFRAACLATFPRIIIFEVGGYINLRTIGIVRIDSPFCWVAGQTAPDPGISLRGETLQVRTTDVLIQHIRARTGAEIPLVSNGGQGPSCFGIYRIGSTQTANRVVFDHCSAAWASDASYDFNASGLATVSNCISTENLRYGGTPRPILIAYNSNRVSIIRTIFAHGGNRQPAVDNARGISVNNLIYDQFQGQGTFISDANASGNAAFMSVVKCRYIQGPTPPTSGTVLNGITVHASLTNTASKLHLSGNTFVGARYTGREFINQATFDPRVASPPAEAPISGITTIDSTAVESALVADAGARPWDRDPVDVRTLQNISNRTATSTNVQTESDVGGFPTLSPPSSSTSHTLPASPHSDGNGDGYTNLEDWIHAFEV